MRKAGGLIAIISGVFGFVAALVTLFIGGIGGAFEAEGSELVSKLGWGGVLFSFLIIILGAIQMSARGFVVPALVIVSSLLGAILGGTLVAICLMLSLVGGALGLFQRPMSKSGDSATILYNNDSALIHPSILAVGALISLAILAIVAILVVRNEDRGSRQIYESQEYAGKSIDIEPPEYTSSIGAPISEQQRHFLRLIEKFRTKYEAAHNDMVKGGLRTERKAEMCEAQGRKISDPWFGEVTELSSNQAGDGVLSISIGEDIHLATWNNAFSDIGSGTLIVSGENLFRQVSQMQVGDSVAFTGEFFFSALDCLEVQNLTMNGAMTAPEFVFKFTSVESVSSYLARSSSNTVEVSDFDRVLEAHLVNQEEPEEEVPSSTDNSPPYASEGRDASSTASLPPKEGERNFEADAKTHSVATPEDSGILIVEVPIKLGFMLRDTDAALDLNDSNSATVSLRNGTEVSISGQSSDNLHYEVQVRSMNDKLYVPMDTVAVFGE